MAGGMGRVILRSFRSSTGQDGLESIVEEKEDYNGNHVPKAVINALFAISLFRTPSRFVFIMQNSQCHAVKF